MPFSSLHPRAQYILFQREKCPKTNRLHWQGFYISKNKTRLSALRKILPGAHWEPMRASDSDLARDYCRKNDTREAPPVEYGVYKRSIPGNRTDIAQFRDAILAKMSVADLWLHFPNQMAKYRMMYADLRDAPDGIPGAVPKSKPRKVILIIGKPQLGKTSLFWSKCTDPETGRYTGYNLPFGKSISWFDRYRGQTHALFDDFVGQVQLNLLLQLLHEHPFDVPIKGGFVWWTPEKIYITSNFHPYDWYKWDGREDHRLALCARFTHILHRTGVPRTPSTWVTTKLTVQPDDPLSTFDKLRELMGGLV